MNATHDGAAFRVGLIQMRSGRSPAANLDAAVKLIDAAKRDGADYVQTPEMTNIMEVKRDSLFAAITAEEQDASLAAFRESRAATRSGFMSARSRSRCRRSAPPTGPS